MAEFADLVGNFIKTLKAPRMRFVVIPISWILMPLNRLFSKIPFVQGMIIRSLTYPRAMDIGAANVNARMMIGAGRGLLFASGYVQKRDCSLI